MHHPVHVPGFWGVFLVSNFIHLFIFISWRLITLQYCSGFCHTLKDGSDNPICKTEKETQIYRTDFWTVWEKARVGCFKRTASKHVYYLGWNRSPAQVGCMRQVLRPGALGKPRGIGWRGRWEGGSVWGIHVYPWLIHVACFVTS